MNKFFAAALAAALIAGFGAPAFAFHCPKDMKAIDAALAQSPKLNARQMTEVAKLRAEGEAQHKAGKHADSVKTLKQAMDILGISK